MQNNSNVKITDLLRQLSPENSKALTRIADLQRLLDHAREGHRELSVAALEKLIAAEIEALNGQRPSSE